MMKKRAEAEAVGGLGALGAGAANVLSGAGAHVPAGPGDHVAARDLSAAMSQATAAVALGLSAGLPPTQAAAMAGVKRPANGLGSSSSSSSAAGGPPLKQQKVLESEAAWIAKYEEVSITIRFQSKTLELELPPDTVVDELVEYICEQLEYADAANLVLKEADGQELLRDRTLARYNVAPGAVLTLSPR